MNSLRTAEMAMTEWKRGSVRERESEAHFSTAPPTFSVFLRAKKKARKKILTKANTATGSWKP